MSTISKRAEVAAKLADLYRELVCFSTPVFGRIRAKTSNANRVVNIVSSQRNLERAQISKIDSTFEVNFDLKSSIQVGRSIDVSNELLFSLSPSERFHSVIRQAVDPDSLKSKQYLEIWKDLRLLRNFDLDALDLHGDIYTDESFGCLQWSPNEQFIAYVAEKKRPKSAPFYKQKPASKPKSSAEEEPNQGEEYTYVEEWGEQLVGKSQSVICLCDIEAGSLRVLEGVPENYCPGEVTWARDSSALYGTVFDTSLRRLGLVYCTNRRSAIFSLTLAGDFNIVSEAGQAAWCARPSPDGQRLVWLQRASEGAHDACKKLIALDLQTKKVNVVVDLVDAGKPLSEGGVFYGIYTQRLPQRCFSDDSKTLVFDSTKIDVSRVYSVNIETGDVVDILSGTILDVFENHVLIVKSTPTRTPHAELLSLTTATSIPVTKPIQMFNSLDSTIFDRVSIGEDINAMLFMPSGRGDGTTPLIVFPHGGPHSVLTEGYSVEPAFYVRLGFAVLLVNYRGSTGAGERNVQSLPGHIGDMDVKDVHGLAEKALSLQPALKKDGVIAYGGSHGGYLSLQLIGQYPDFYKAAAVRNPVVDLPVMLGTSDIPDWVTVESGSDFTYTTDVSSEHIQQMWTMSPMRHVGDIKADTLFLVGSVDQRVPCSQSLYIYKVLKARGVKTKLHMYKDNHALSKVPVHIDALINSALWIYDAVGQPADIQ